MARKKRSAGFGVSLSLGGGHSHGGDEFAVHHAYHTLKDAHKIVGNKPLMRKVKAHHDKLGAEHASFGHAADNLVKMGRISTKAIRGMKVKKPKRGRVT